MSAPVEYKNQPKVTWDFTLNNYTEKELAALESWGPEVRRLVVTKEIGESKTPHLQGRVLFKRAYRLTGLKKLLSRANWSPTKCKQDFLYPLKDDSTPFLNVDNRQGQGTRNDLIIAKSKILGKRRASEMFFDDEIISTVAKHTRWCRTIFALKPTPPRAQPPTSFLWKLVEPIVNSEPDRRTIHWFWDNLGNVGKSEVATYITSNYEGVTVNGKRADIIHGYDNQPVVVFDLARDEQFVSYAAMEAFKNGRDFSPKYESGFKWWPVPHVIVFSNFPPNLTKLSRDRFKITHLDALDIPEVRLLIAKNKILGS